MRFEKSTQERLANNPSSGSWESRVVAGSRYQGIPVVRTIRGGERTPVVMDRTFTNVGSYIIHTSIGSERFEHIAARYLGDPRFWWRIADANPEFFYPTCPPGTSVRVPI